MDNNINSASYEGAPLLSADGKQLYIYRTGHPENMGITNNPKDEDIWFSRKASATSWTKMKNIGAPLNGIRNSGVCGISSDGNILYLYDFYTSVNTVGIAISFKTENGWSKPKSIPIENFYFLNTLVWLYISSDGRTLLMSLQRADTEGLSDIYVSFMQPSGSFSSPKNLGPVVNSNKREVSPFLAADNKTLYYASEGKPGYGNMDIYVTRRLDDTWQKWSVPENLGPNINTPKWDTEFSISADGSEAYMVSGGEDYGDNTDVYKIELPTTAHPSHMRMLCGYLTDYSNGKPLQGEIRFFDANGKDVGNALPDHNSGYYKMYLSDTMSYSLRAEKEGYFAVVERIETNTSLSDSIRKDLQLVPLKKGGKVDLRNIYFEQSKYELKKESTPQLNEIQKVMAQNASMKIKITGHTDNQGNPKDNEKLSLDRANEVKKHLVQMGISGSRILVNGKGGTSPIVPNDSDENRKLNRRVEFEILEL